MNYRSISDLNEDIKNWIPELPEDLDLIVGIPRSGLLVANILALHLNLPFTDVQGLFEDRIYETGARFSSNLYLSKMKNILVVDDSLFSGQQMEHVKIGIKAADLPQKIYYGVLYIVPEGCRKVDFWYKVIDAPRVFEWNILHHPILEESCIDIDGVLCRDPTSKENDDGECYRNFIMNVKPFVIPSIEIGWLVTCRLEKYRNLTEKWLNKYNIKYRNLIMMNLPDKETRLFLGRHAKFKAEVYKSSKATLFIESSKGQAYEIVNLTGKPVFCTEIGEMINPGLYRYAKGYAKEVAKRAMNNPFIMLIKVPNFLKWKFRKIIWLIRAKIRKRKQRG